MTCSRGDYRPGFAGTERADEAWARRVDAANISMGRPALSVPSNQEENEHFPTARIGNFSKGLPHDGFGIVDGKDYDAFVKALVCFDWKFNVPTGVSQERARKWEGPLVGHDYSLDGPDPADLAMAPAPRIGCSEQTAELAELYAIGPGSSFSRSIGRERRTRPGLPGRSSGQARQAGHGRRPDR